MQDDDDDKKMVDHYNAEECTSILCFLFHITILQFTNCI